jgi:hypothetical protein
VTNPRPHDTPDNWRERVEAALKGTFVLERELRAGSTNRVFVGSETALGRRVVIKMLIPGVPGGEQEVEFRREAVTAARLHHPHIVPIFTIGTVLGVPYFTMPFIDGESLRSRLDRAGALPLDAAMRVVREIGSALAFAHELGVVHRDVKPENIVLERGTGRALLGDFGIACASGDSRSVTPVGMTAGTPVYMSPEQVDGLELDGRSDTYSLGLVAWEMLVGVRPWSGTSLDDVMYRQKHVPLPPLETYASEVPKRVADAIERALCKNRGERWPSVTDFLEAIDPAGRSSSRRDDGFPSAEWSLDTPWETIGAVSPPANVDPAAVETVPLAARRELHGLSSGVAAPRPRAIAFRGSRARDDALERRRQRIRWIAAACAAALVTTGLVAAMSGHQGIVHWASTLGEVTSDAPRVPAVDSIAIDTIAMPVAAAGLASLEPVGPMLVSDSLSLPPLDTPSWHVAVARAHAGARAPEPGLSSYDPVRARAATATLSLQAYQAAVAGATLLRAPAAVTPEPVGNDTNSPATGVRVAPRRRAAASAAASPIQDSSSPAVGVRVHAPRTP